VEPYFLIAAVIDLDVTYFFQLGLFLVFLVVMNAVLFKPLLALFERRKAETEMREKQAGEGSKEAERLLALYEREMSQATAQGMAERNRVREEALRVESDQLASARTSAAAWMEQEMSRHSKQIRLARQQAMPATQTLAGELVELLSTPRGRSE